MITDLGRGEDYFFSDYNLKLYHLIFSEAGLMHKLQYNNGAPFDLTKEDVRQIDEAQTRLSDLVDAIQAGNKRTGSIPLTIKIKEGYMIKDYGDRVEYIPKGHKDYDISEFE